MNYYNEYEPFAAQWLRNLIAEGLIPAGDVDTRSITDVQPDELAGYRQCHFFAGIGGWSLAARFAGWPDDRELWTGSAPCQPFSVAGKGKAQADDRHLWPHLFRLARTRRPAVLMGEQVAAAVGKDWIDGVFADLEGIGYACGASVVPACAVDAPHRRDRLWFVAHADDARPQGQHRHELRAEEGRGQPVGPAAAAGVLDCAEHAARDVGHAACPAGERRARAVPPTEAGQHRPGQLYGSEPFRPEYAGEGGHWAGAGCVIGHDGKARRIEPSIRLLAHGVSGRVGRLRAYGNAIVPQIAAEVIGAYMDCYPEKAA